MKKDTVRAIGIVVILLAVFHVIAFAVPFVRTAAFWISYGFSLAAFGVAAVSIYIAFIQKPDAKSRFYGFPIARIGVVYGAAQLAAALAVMALAKWVPGWAAAAVFAVGLGAAAVGMISAEAVAQEIVAQDGKQQKQTSAMRQLQSRMEALAARSENAALKALAEELRYSDPVSSEATAAAEAALSAAVGELEAAREEDLEQLCRKAGALLAERNRLCRLNKNG